MSQDGGTEHPARVSWEMVWKEAEEPWPGNVPELKEQWCHGTTPRVPTSISPAHQPGVMVLRPVGPGGRPGSAPCPHCHTAGAGSGSHPALPGRVPAEGAVTFMSWALLCGQPGLQRGMEESLSLRRLAESSPFCLQVMPRIT